MKNQDKIVFCYIAHTVWLKGLIYFIEACNKVSLENIEIKIAGTINKDVLNYIDVNFDKHNIQFLGHVPNINNFFRTSHVCVIPSLLDAGPATVAEALYCGLPVITTQGCGSKTLIEDGKNGFVVPIADSNAIAKKMKWFIDNQDQIPKMSKYAVKSIASIDNSNQNEEFAKHIMVVVDRLKIEKGIL